MKKLILIYLLIYAYPAMAAIAYVNDSNGGNYSGSNINSISTNPLSTTTGNLLVVTIGVSGTPTVTSVTDTAGDTFVEASGCANTANGIMTDIWYAANIIGNASNVVTSNISSSNAYYGTSQIQFSGASTSSPFITCATGTATSATTVTSGSFSPTTSGNVNVATVNSSGGTSWTAGTNYTLFGYNVSEYYAGAPSGAQTASANSSNALNLNISAAAFQAAGAVPFTTTSINSASINNASIN